LVLRNYSDSATVATLDISTGTGGQNYYFIHRADLVACLLSAARQTGVQVRLQHKVKQVQTSVIPQVVLTNGQTIMADLVVGADGLHSCLRPVLNQTAAPRFTGQVAWRALVPRQSQALAQVQLYMGPGRHLVTYPLRGGQLVNVVAVQERANWAAEGWQHRDDPQNLRRAFADFSPDVQPCCAVWIMCIYGGYCAIPLLVTGIKIMPFCWGMRPTRRCHFWRKGRIWRSRTPGFWQTVLPMLRPQTPRWRGTKAVVSGGCGG
jgi:2-polyprenyl-6-methoxyphenol hydroxylase-like FAD-dependent oxidoreductase